MVRVQVNWHHDDEDDDDNKNNDIISILLDAEFILRKRVKNVYASRVLAVFSVTHFHMHVEIVQSTVLMGK